jgi:uncharacterized protein (TIGR01777 family)
MVSILRQAIRGEPNRKGHTIWEMQVGITGASGLIGTALTRHLEAAGHGTTPFVRQPAKVGEVYWQPSDGELDPGDLEGLDAIVHLAGAGIGDQRWTDSYKRTLLDSRVKSTTLIADTMAQLGDSGPQVLLSGSAIGFYGDRGDEQVDESSQAGTGFLSEICQAWEACTESAERAGKRVAHLRTGIVLSSEGGALKKMLPLFRLFAGGRFGSGQQWMSWISIIDEVRAIEHLLQADINGPVNLTAPHPVRNADFARELGRALRRPSMVPVPRFGPKLLLGGELSDALLFDGQHVRPTVLLAEPSFEFEHQELSKAFQSVLPGRS